MSLSQEAKSNDYPSHGANGEEWPTLFEAVIVWSHIALLSFGGPAGQIAVRQRQPDRVSIQQSAVRPRAWHGRKHAAPPFGRAGAIGHHPAPRQPQWQTLLRTRPRWRETRTPKSSVNGREKMAVMLFSCSSPLHKHYPSPSRRSTLIR